MSLLSQPDISDIYNGDEGNIIMKAIMKILFFHGDDDSLGPIFKAIFQRQILDDPVLVTAGLRLDSVGNGSEGEPLQESVCSALRSMGIQEFEHTSKNIWLHRDLVQWADLILVPSLLEEDILCLNFREAWSKILPIECYCGQYYTETRFHPGTAPQTEEECRIAADTFKKLLPHVIDKVKDSYAKALIVRGVSIYAGIVAGKAFVVKQAGDLESFEEDSILVIDRPGTILYQEIDEAKATNIIKKFGGKTTGAMLAEFEAKLEGKTVEPSSINWSGDGFAAFQAVLTKAEALICSRGRHGGEISAKALKIPCVSSCVGATEYIVNRQVIVADAGRGEVYDASLLETLD